MALKDSLSKLWSFVSHASTLDWIFRLLCLFAASSVTSGQVSVMPSGWYPPQYWALAGTWFFGTLTVAMSLVKVGHWTYRVLRPLLITVQPYGGEDATLVVNSNTSAVVKFFGTGQLLELSEMTYRRVRPFQLDLRSGYVCIATAKSHRYGKTIQLHGDGYGSIIEGWDHAYDKWIRLAVTIQTNPPMRKPLTKMYEFRLIGSTGRFEVREIRDSAATSLRSVTRNR